MLTAPQMPGKGDEVLPWARRVTLLLKRLLPQASEDIFPQCTTAGTSYVLRRRPARGGRYLPPFGIFQNGSAGTDRKFKCNPLSTVMDGDDWGDVATIANLTTEWTGAANDKVWLKADFGGDGTLTAVTLEHGYGWDDFPVAHVLEDPEEEDGPSHWFHLLAFFRPIREGETADVNFGEEDKQKLIQCTTTHLIASSKCSLSAESGLIRVLAPWAGGIAPEE